MSPLNAYSLQPLLIYQRSSEGYECQYYVNIIYSFSKFHEFLSLAKKRFIADLQTSPQREHDKSVCVIARSMCITQRKIVSNYCFNQCSNKYCLQNIMDFDTTYYIENNSSLQPFSQDY